MEFCDVQNSLCVQVLCSSTVLHCVSENVPHLTSYNFDIPDPITIIFGRRVTKKVRNQTMLCFPTWPICCFCTTLRNRKPRDCVFSLKHHMLLCQRTHKTHLNYHLVAAELPFIPEVIDCMHQTSKTYLEREHSILLSVCHPHALCLPSLSQCRSRKRWELFFVKPGMKVNGQY